MVSAAFAVSLLALFASTAAIQLFCPLDHHLVAMTSSVQAVQALLPLAALGALMAAVASIYRQLHRAAAEAAGAAGTGVAFAAVSAAAGVIEFFTTFVAKPTAEEYADSARARELRAAAAHLLPAAATATFFLGLGLLFVHVRAGGRAVVAGEGHAKILVKIALGATAVLVGLMALAQYIHIMRQRCWN